MQEIEIKGQALRTFFEVVREQWGKSTEQKLHAGLQGALREHLDRGALLSSGWYPVAWYRQCHEVVAALHPNESNLAFRLGEATVKKDLAGMYRFMLKLTSPDLVARHIDKVVGSFMRGGELSVEFGHRKVSGVMRGWHGVNRTIWEDFCGGGKVVLETAGACNLTAEVREQSPGTALFNYEWTR